ncbi:hypothetical protein ACFLTE_00185 [Bacteroidota bacterium]
MKKKIILSILVILFAVGCGEKYIITTQIFTDGSCHRKLVVTSDKDDFDSTRFPISIDTSWLVCRKVDSLDSTIQYKYIAEKKYLNVNDINNEFLGGNRYSSVKRNIYFNKYFRWFYTIYKYEEKYERLFHQYPIDSFLIDDEIQILHSDMPDTMDYFKGMDSALMEKNYELIDDKYWHWVKSSLYEEYFNAFINKLKEKRDTIYIKELYEYKDSIYRIWHREEFNIDTLFILSDSLICAKGKLGKYYTDKDSIFIEIDKKIDFWEDVLWDDNIENKIIMPGKLIKSNADFINADTAIFNIHWEKYFSKDYSMNVISKRKNSWANYVTLIIFAILVILYIRRKR